MRKPLEFIITLEILADIVFFLNSSTHECTLFVKGIKDSFSVYTYTALYGVL
jgi:hypothetical protein